jgi:hypothetical protein
VGEEKVMNRSCATVLAEFCQMAKKIQSAEILVFFEFFKSPNLGKKSPDSILSSSGEQKI